MKRYSLVFLSAILIIGSLSCKKINEATELGGDLIPAIDNITTFEVFFDAETDNRIFSDTARTRYPDQVALGITEDPVFGNTRADVYFNLSSAVYGFYPFFNKDSVIIDSVVLQLAYARTLGDTNAVQTVSVWEIAQNSGFKSDTLFYYNGDLQPAFSHFGSSLGSKTFTVNQLNDTMLHVRKNDTVKIFNVLRIPLSNSLGTKLASFDTTNSSNGGYHRDSIFKTLFRGIKIVAENSTNPGALTYYQLDNSNTRLTVYFRVGASDTTAPVANFFHSTNGQANLVTRTPAGSEYGLAVNDPSPTQEKLYLQSAPGSYATFRIPRLDTFSNKIVHIAELITHKLPSAGDNFFPPPARLMLDRKGTDSAFFLERDLQTSPGGGVNYVRFGGSVLSDNTVRFNISRHVQGIVTRHEPNDTLRVYAPLRTELFTTGGFRFFFDYVNPVIANGRVVLAGSDHPNAALRPRLRIVYSTIQ